MSEAIDRRGFLAFFARPLFRKGSLAAAEGSLGAPTIARLDASLCLAVSGADCRICAAACPEGENGLVFVCEIPTIVPGGCTGCGECVSACEAVNTTPALALVRRAGFHVNERVRG
jgi:ferredoxin